MQVGRLRQEARHRGFACSRRAPKDQRAERARLQHARENAVAAEQMILADHIGEPIGTKLVGKRPRRGAFQPGSGEQGWGRLFWARAQGPLMLQAVMPALMRGVNDAWADHHKRWRAGTTTTKKRSLGGGSYPQKMTKICGPPRSIAPRHCRPPARVT